MSPATRTALLRDLALRLDKSSLTVADECLRFRFEEAPDLLALMASGGELLYDEVLALVRSTLAGETSIEDAATRVDSYGLRSLMRLTAGLQASGELGAGDYREAADIAQVARLLVNESRPFSAVATRVEGQTNLASGRFDYVARMLEEFELNSDTAWMLGTELAHPANGAPDADASTWLTRFNRRFEEFGLAPIALRPGDGTPFDRVTADVPDDRVMVDGPLVTVIMSTYCPDQSLRTAVESLIRQTWRNLEILVIDDCSPPEYDALLAEVAALDPRVSVSRMPVNGGTYVIRNVGISRARGEFVTFQDSDDWAHPERIARQLGPLLDDDKIVVTHCRCVRVFPDLSTLNVGMNSFRRCAPSTLFRKGVVVAALGGYDETRKEADNEFYERLQVVFGESANLDLPDVLVLYQLTRDSLSRDEYRFAWQHGTRASYIEARRFWHRRIAAGRESARLELDGRRRIPAPSRVLTGRDAEPQTCDVLWMSDWRDGLARYDGQVGLVRATADAGLSTLVAHATTVRNAHRDRVNLRDELLQLQAEGTSRIVVWSDPTHARLAVVTDPELLNLTRPPDRVGITADRVIVAAPHPPRAPDGGWLTYAPTVVEANALRMFGTRVEWLPASSSIAAALRDDGAQNVLDPALLIVAPDVRERSYAGPRGHDVLVVGTCALDPRRRDRPNVAALRSRLPTSGAHDVRVLDSRMCALQERHPRSMPLSWLALEERLRDVGFQHQLDVFAPVPTRTSGPSVPWAAVTALAEGAVVVAGPELEPFFGDAALYAAPGEVEATLRPLAADPRLLDAQRARGYAFCRDRASGRALVDLIGTLVPGREDSR